MVGNARFTSRIKQWSTQKVASLDVAVLSAATDIHRVSGMFAPKETRALVNSGRIEKKGIAHYVVIYGGGPVHYARRRHYENKKTPSSLHYLERAGDATSRNFKQRYIKRIK